MRPGHKAGPHSQIMHISRKDIETRADIDLLMNRFYSRAIADDVIGYIFTDVAKLNLQHHLPIIGDFWDSLLFQAGNYARHRRAPLQVHADLNEKTPLLPEHFERWLMIFTEISDELFEGERCDFMKGRAAAIANRIQTYVDDEAMTA
jgi:hemoglobin